MHQDCPACSLIFTTYRALEAPFFIGKTNMFYQDVLMSAATTVMDWDLPPELLPLTITNQAALLANVAPELVGRHRWD
jgi:hypothetical protein